jgi:hypothetical protein
MQNAQLSELLHMAHEKPIMVRDENSFFKQQNNDSWSPDVENSPNFVEKPTNINLRTRDGMPKHIQHDENAALFRVINANKTIVWTPPIQACKSIAITLTDRQQLQDDDDRYVRVILRAMPCFHVFQSLFYNIFTLHFKLTFSYNICVSQINVIETDNICFTP